MLTHLPNLITLGNLFFGCCAAVCLLSGYPELVPWLLLASFLCDYADGMLARALGVSSPLGKELDSLADVVSFGVVPGAMLYHLLAQAFGTTMAGAEHYPVCIKALPAFVLSMCAALRLGKFNLDTRQTGYFLGLTTPACTVFILGIFSGAQHNIGGLAPWLLQPWFLYGLIPILGLLMLSEIPMFGLKIKKLDLKSNLFNLAFIGIFLLLVFFFKALACSAVVLLYILLSLAFKNKVIELAR